MKKKKNRESAFLRARPILMHTSQNSRLKADYTSCHPGNPTNCDESWCREGVREGMQGYQLRLETAPVLLCRLIVSVEL